ncbi:hypothetical protein T4E_341 [Trichinella pseudospiralis]|uniref:Uncharacterized protein n=1 Tax=Trichinella pseudospiralis TaxID=6337 RepID=A0A0V0XV65_TRIPS|nr:hypothetical protein T4E_341 [Trichinella pseudospiralis]
MISFFPICYGSGLAKIGEQACLLCYDDDEEEEETTSSQLKLTTASSKMMTFLCHNKNGGARITVDQDIVQVILNRLQNTRREMPKSTAIDAIVRASLKQILHSTEVGIFSDFFHIVCPDGRLSIISRSHFPLGSPRGRSLFSIGPLS